MDIKFKLGLKRRVLVVCGSLREESLTIVLTDVAYEYAKKDYDNVEYLDLRKTRINNFEGFEAEYNEVTKRTVKLVEGSDVFILGCPIYNGLLGSALKNLFEFVNYKALEGRVAGLRARMRARV